MSMRWYLTKLLQLPLPSDCFIYLSLCIPLQPFSLFFLRIFLWFLWIFVYGFWIFPLYDYYAYFLLTPILHSFHDFIFFLIFPLPHIALVLFEVPKGGQILKLTQLNSILS